MLKIAGKEENMEQLLEEIYEKAIYASDMYNELNQKLDEEVETLIQPLKDQISAKELDELRGLIYSASFVAERQGFKLGVHVAVKFLTESLNVTGK